MTFTDWIVVAAALLGGFTIGTISSRIIRGWLRKRNRSEALRNSAGAISGLVLSVFVVIGFIVALGVIDPAALDQLPKDFIALLPKLLVAAVLIIGANILSSIVETALGPTLARLPSMMSTRVIQLVKLVIVGFASLMAVRQVGVDTTIINMAVASFLFGSAAALALMIGLGGRQVASEVASSRVIRRVIAEGDVIEMNSLRGEVKAIHPTMVEIKSELGVIELVPSSKFTTERFAIHRLADAD